MKKKITAVIVAAGNGSRMQSQIKKQYRHINGRAILSYTVEKFYRLSLIDQIVIVCDAENLMLVREQMIEKLGYADRVKAVVGGQTRTQSVYNGVKAAEGMTDYILIHDGVRPLIAHTVIVAAIHKAFEMHAAIVCSKAQDTMKVVKDEKIVETLDRNTLWHAETPQVFEYQLLKKCMEKAMMTDILFTDEAAILEYFGHDVYVVENHEINRKITTSRDLAYAEFLMKEE